MDKCWNPPIRPDFPGLFAQHIVDIAYTAWIILRSRCPSLKALKFVCNYGLFNVFMMVIAILKEIINDRTCSDKPNSPSGHTYYHVFIVIMFLTRFFHKNKYRSLMSKLAMAVFLGLHGYNQTITYIGAYHSMRQILYGAIFGAAVWFFGAILKYTTSIKNLIVVYGTATIGLGLYANRITEVLPVANIAAIAWFPFALWAFYIDKKDKFE